MRLACLSLVANISLAIPLAAQQPKVLAPHNPIFPKDPPSRVRRQPGTPRSMIGGFWMIDPNSKASLHLKNGLETDAITVTPALFLSNGARYDLPPLTLAPSATTVLSINDALQANGVAPWGTLSGYVEIGYTWAWNPICATVTSVDAVHSTIFTTGFQPSVADNLPIHKSRNIAGLNTVEGLWWKPEAGVTGFVALSNASAQPVTAKVKTTTNKNIQIGEQTVQISPHGTKIIQLDALQSLPPGATGGLQITYHGSSSTMLVNGALENLSSGFSANLPFHPFATPDPGTQSHETYAELGLMTGPADPMLSFPAGTTFTPFSVLRNVEDSPVTATPSFFWMEGGVARSAQLASFTVAPFNSVALDVPTLLAQAGLGTFHGSVNLILDAAGQPRSLLLAGGSVDAKQTYVFQVLPHGIQESAAKSISYWSTGNGDDTMVTVWNPADEAQDFRFALTFTGGHYVLPIHLEPRATYTFNISEVIQNQIPDSEGNTIPLGVHEGSAKISGIQADNEQILVALDAGTYNVRKATCSYYCISCDGIEDSWVDGGSVTPFVVGSQSQFNLHEDWNNGNSYYTNTGSWNSNYTDVATIGSSNGLGNGVSPGTTTLSDYFTTGDIYNSDYCAVDPYCPYVSSFAGSGVVPVSLTVTFGYTPVVPLNGTATITATVSGNTKNASIGLMIAAPGDGGDAVFLDTGTHLKSITSTTTLDVQGVFASSSPNNIQLLAYISSTTLATTNFTVAATNGAIPVNFRQTSAYPSGPGTPVTVNFTYVWDSSTGNVADLSNCNVQELVSYPIQSQNPGYFFFPNPPYVANSYRPNPDTGPTPVSATYGSPGLIDTQSSPGFATPYTYSSFTATQVYQFQCTNYQANQWIQFFPQSGNIPITRTVQSVNGQWQYTVTKSGLSNTGNLQ